MEENKNLTPSEEPKAPEQQAQANAVVSVPKKAPAKTQADTAAQKPGKLAEIKAEFKKIVWPGKTELRKKTGSVIVTSIVMAVIIFAMDTVYTTLYNLVLGLIG